MLILLFNGSVHSEMSGQPIAGAGAARLRVALPQCSIMKDTGLLIKEK
jgi:hypothetical protein